MERCIERLRACPGSGKCNRACSRRFSTIPPARAEITVTTETVRKRTERDGNSLSVEEQIEYSKSHWSQVVKPGSRKPGSKKFSRFLTACFGGSRPNADEKVVDESNVQVFKAFQSHPAWGCFFCTFGYDFGIRESCGSLMVGEKFVKGEQVELFHAHIMWKDKQFNECLRDGCEWVLKVCKKGTLLSDLEKQWPCGLLQDDAKQVKYVSLGMPPPLAYICDVECGTLLEDGWFVFVLRREDEDLRAYIDWYMKLKIGQEYGPFEKRNSQSFHISCYNWNGMVA